MSHFRGMDDGMRFRFPIFVSVGSVIYVILGFLWDDALLCGGNFRV